ncbi:MAG: DUF4286 family protein [Chitinophagaceae bacterium]|nr:DUF4286 family protein [Chitinophagaceae bacterium]
MIVYNVTTKVNWSVHDDWLQWMQREHIPDVMATGLFFDSKILRLLEIDDGEGPTYAIQYYASAIENYRTYIEQHAVSFRKEIHEKWGDQIIAFRSLMEVLH